jgi:predicted HTH domain antitoxin
MELTIDIPEKYIINQSPEKLKKLLKLNTAIDMYRNGVLSVGAAIEFIGQIDRYEFLYECKQRGIEHQTYEDIDELKTEVAMLDKELS